MSRLIEVIRRVAQQEVARNRGSLLGVVTTVYPHESEDDDNNYEANVRLKHEDLELRRVPIAVGHVGVAAPPRVGDLVLVQFLNGDPNQPLVTGRFYHADERPPLHRQDEILFEQRVTDGTLNHLRFASDGAIYVQRDVTKPEDNSAAKTSIKVEPEGDVELKVGEKITVRLALEGNAVSVTCDAMTVTAKDGLKVSNGTTSTTINGNEITGALQP